MQQYCPNCPTHNRVRNGNHTKPSPQFCPTPHNMDLQNAEYRYGMPHPWVWFGSGLWVRFGLGLQLELLMAFVVWCEKKYCQKSIGIGIGNTFCQSIGTGIGNTYHKYC